LRRRTATPRVPQVHVERTQRRELLHADGAEVVVVALVSLHVTEQRGLQGKRGAALFTLKTKTKCNAQKCTLGSSFVTSEVEPSVPSINPRKTGV
jgi:hypothetical protein